jgi:subtilisin
MSIASSLKATGVADVIVVLKRAKVGQLAATGDLLPARIIRHFHTSRLSQDGALLEALSARGAVFSARAAAGGTSAEHISATAAPASKARYYPNLGLVLGTVDRAGVAALRNESSVDQVVDAPQLRLIKPVVTAAAEMQSGYTWGLKALGVDRLHAQGLTGHGVLIGHLDTGVDASHPALAESVKLFAEFDSLGNQVGGAKAQDSGEHGTHTAGTIAGRPIRGVHFGVAPGAKLVSAMVIEGGNVLARILGGMNWTVGQKVRVLSMSLGLPGYDEAFLALTQILRARGVLPVFAVGNEGAGTSRYPGNYVEALSVGAMDSEGNVADFSSSQRLKRKKDPIVPDLVAPGMDIVSCVPDGKYMQMSGTSMATPHIAGLAALLMEAKPGKTIDQIEAAIFKSCTLNGGNLASRANRGFPNGILALDLL